MAVDPKQVEDIVAKINAIPDCTQLTAYAQKQIKAWLKEMEDTLKAKASAAAKKVVPTNLDEVINWIQTFVTEAQQQYEDAVAAFAEMAAAYTTITNAITDKATKLGCGVIPIPPIPE